MKKGLLRAAMAFAAIQAVPQPGVTRMGSVDSLLMVS